ncbi:MAG: dockerin type I repeat-containing protein, partial [Oscillospiraceae bacterium]|nr:dockerin type I repeat-containing protein [Oscillospiraceae bacterium]
MKKIRKTLAGIVALSMFASNAVYISAAEEVKNDAGSQTASEDAAGSSAEAKYTKELAEIMANADNSEKIPVWISLADIDPSVLDAKIREKFNGKYGTLDEYYNYEEVILPRIIEESEKEFGEFLAHARLFIDEETSEMIIADFDAYVSNGSELRKMKKSMSNEELDAYIHSEFSEEDLKKAYESSDKGYSVITARLSHDIDDYRMAVVDSKIELQHKNVSDCLTKYISEDEILSNALNNCSAMLTKDQIEEISRDSQVTRIMYASPVPADSDSSAALIVEEDEIKPGDIYSDGIIDLSDLSTLSLFLVGDTDLEDSQKKAADVDGDDEITLADLARLRQYLSKKIDSLTDAENADAEMQETDVKYSAAISVRVTDNKLDEYPQHSIIEDRAGFEALYNEKQSLEIEKTGFYSGGIFPILNDKYTDEWFETHKLYVAYPGKGGPTGYRYNVESVTNKTVTIHWDQLAESQSRTENKADWIILIEVAKDADVTEATEI